MRKTKEGFQWNRQEIRIAALIVAAVVLVMVAIAPWRDRDTVIEEPQEQVLVRRAIDGVFVPEEKAALPIVGVMVENMEEAQPISGIANANLVFEAITEANITRFLVYFVLDQEIQQIGPVRSARPYYLDFAAPFNTLYAHVGSSPAAYQMLQKQGVDGIYDLDQWYNPEYFWRTKDNGRRAPHNVYTSTELLKEAYKEIEQSRTLDLWFFKAEASPDLRGDVNDIQIGYIGLYDVQWLYDKSENHYKRMQWGGVHKMEDGPELIAKNIAVAFMEMEVLDEIGRKSFTTLGEGKGLVFQDGRVVVGTWKKSTVDERMRWYDAQGNEVKFNAGVTWVEIVPERYEVGY